MDLKLGKMTSPEVAEWLGIKYGTYRKKKEQYLSRLTEFCNYELVYGGIIVKEIYIPVYDKTLRTKCDKLYLDEINRCIQEQDGLSTISGMARKMVREGKFDSVSTARRQLAQSGNRLFGKIVELTGKGIAGTRERIWAIKENDYNRYRLMNQEEEKRFNEIIELYYTSDVDRVKKAALLEETYKNSEDMTKEEYFEQKERLGLNIFRDCIFQFANETGLMVVHCTKHDFMTKFDISDEDRAYLESLDKE